MTNLGLYIHIPFCKAKCFYCDFASFVCNENVQKKYIDCLCQELNIRSKDFKNKTFDSIYIGGGTPSTLFDGAIKQITDCVFKNYSIAKNIEFTIEVNPNSVTETKLNEYKNCGINRISMGVQSLRLDTLKLIGRNQNKNQVDIAFDLIKNSGITNISADIMLGLPKQTKQNVKDIIEYFGNNKVKHISAYMLQLEEGTTLYNKVMNGDIALPNEEETVKLYEYAMKISKDLGYDIYEISNFALPGFESKHNLKYWDGTEYLGVGVAGSSYYNNHRVTNTSDLDKYLTNLANKYLAIESDELIDLDTRRTEKIMLSLRTTKGLDLKLFEKTFDENLLQTKKDIINKYEQTGALQIKNDYLIVSKKYFAISNQIILDLI